MGNIKDAIEEAIKKKEVYECVRCKELITDKVKRIDDLIVCEMCYWDLIYDAKLEERSWEQEENE